MEPDKKILFEQSAAVSGLFFRMMTELWDDHEAKYGAGAADSIMLNVAGNLICQAVARAAGTARGKAYPEEESRPIRNEVKKAIGDIIQRILTKSAGGDADYTFERQDKPPS